MYIDHILYTPAGEKHDLDHLWEEELWLVISRRQEQTDYYPARFAWKQVIFYNNDKLLKLFREISPIHHKNLDKQIYTYSEFCTIQ